MARAKKKFKSEHLRSVQYRERKQAAIQLASNLLTRAVLYLCPNVAWPDLVYFDCFLFSSFTCTNCLIKVLIVVTSVKGILASRSNDDIGRK